MSEQQTTSIESNTIETLKKQLKGNKRYFKGEITKPATLIEGIWKIVLLFKRRLKHLEETHKYVYLVQVLFEDVNNGEAIDVFVLETFCDSIVVKAFENFVEAQTCNVTFLSTKNLTLSCRLLKFQS